MTKVMPSVSGFQRRLEFDELLGVLRKDFKVHLPAKNATNMWDSFAMGPLKESLDGLYELEKKRMAHQAFDNHVRVQAADQGISHTQMRELIDATRTQPGPPGPPGPQGPQGA